MDNTKAYFSTLFDSIMSEIRVSFPEFRIVVNEYKFDYSDEGAIYGCDAVVYLYADNMYISLWYGFSNSANKPFSCTIGFNDASDVKVGFDLKDFLAIRNLDFNRRLLFSWLNEFEDGIEISKQIIAELKILLLDSEVHTYLYTDYDVNVPRDWAPYK